MRQSITLLTVSATDSKLLLLPPPLPPPIRLLLLPPFYGHLSGTTWVSRFQKKHSPIHTYPDHQSSFICFLHLLRSMASFLFNLRAWQSFRIISVQVFFGLPFGLHTFLHQSMLSFCTTCPYHCNQFCCSTKSILPNPSLSLNSSLGTLSFSLMTHIHLTILLYGHWSATWFSFLTGQVSLPSMQHTTSHTTAVVSLSLSMIYPHWYAIVPTAWIYSVQFEFWPPQLHQHLYLHSASLIKKIQIDK